MDPKQSVEDNTGSGDAHRLQRAFDSLDLVDSSLPLPDWAEQVRQRVGDLGSGEWDAWWERRQDVVVSDYSFDYSSFEIAKHFSVSWRSRPLVEECAWMLPRLREAITRSGQAEPFLVEIGAGPGAAAAVLSAALDVPVIAVDSHPLARGLPEQFAQCTGGRVESCTADIADLARVLDGARPAAVFGMGIYAYLQPHQHEACQSFSYWWEMQNTLATYKASSRVDSFIEALAGADLILADMTCVDRFAEVCAPLFEHGYEIPRGGMTRIESSTPDKETLSTGVHFTTADLPRRHPNLLIEMLSPLPRPHAGFESEPDDDVATEALRLNLEPTEFIDSSEVDYTDGSGRLRHEIFGWGKRLIGQYVATTSGYRRLNVYARNDLDALVESIHTDEAQLELDGYATVSGCSLPAPQWGGPLDV